MSQLMDDLIENGPWPVKALCVECGVEYQGMAITRALSERLNREPIPYGTCVSCIAEEGARLVEMTSKNQKKEVIPNLEEARKHYGRDHADTSDPFDGRRDLS